MRRIRNNNTCLRLLAMLTVCFLLIVFSGCTSATNTPAPTEVPVSMETPAPSEAPVSTETPAPSETPVSTETPVPSETPAPSEGSATIEEPETTKAPTEGPQPMEDGAYHVRSVEELMEAIRPDAWIVVEEGYYDLTELMTAYPNTRDIDEWNETHEYVSLRRVYDGVEVVVTGVGNLTIEGTTDYPGDVELVTEPRFATVLCFENCTVIDLRSMTMGHTQGGDCSGSVLKFSGCHGISLSDMDLYGCGVYGFILYNGSGEMLAENCMIHDCMDGPFEIYEPEGDISFFNCSFIDSASGGYYFPKEGSKLSFMSCTFGVWESLYWLENEDAFFENCSWSDGTPETGYLHIRPEFIDPEAMVPTLIVLDELLDSRWTGYAVTQSGSEDVLYLEEWEAVLELFENGAGCYSYDGEFFDFYWELQGEEGILCLYNNDEQYPDNNFKIFVSMYRSETETVPGYAYWLHMPINDHVIWFY